MDQISIESICSGLKSLFRKFLGIILTFMIFPIIILTLPFFVIRQIVIRIAKHVHPELSSILIPHSGQLANNLFTGNPSRGNIISTTFFNGHLNHVDFRNNMVLKNWINARSKETGELVYERFQQYPVRYLGYTFWKRENFNIDDHVFFHNDLPNKTVSNEELKRFEEELLNSSYKPNTSTWEIHLVYNYHNPILCSDPMTVVILKIHHSLSDGYSILGAITEGLFEQSLVDQLIKPVYREQTIWEQLEYFITAPFVLFGEFSHLMADNFRDSPWKVPDSEKSWNQIYDSSDPVPINKIKDVKNAFGVNFTSVLISAISAGICDNFKTNRKIKSLKGDDGSIFCMSTLPVPGHSRNLTNHSTALAMEIPTVEFLSCEERLYHVNSVFETAKNSIIPAITIYLTPVLGAHFYQVGSVLFKPHAISAGITNFPSFGVRLKKGKCQSVSARFAAGCQDSDAGVGFTILSHNEQITFSITAEEAVMSRKELDNFIQCFVREIDLLHKLAIQRNLHIHTNIRLKRQ